MEARGRETWPDILRGSFRLLCGGQTIGGRVQKQGDQLEGYSRIQVKEDGEWTRGNDEGKQTV